jgi:3-phenylpropionate/trans-cinnamate dioxygenase ferredoxin reductase subunit
LRRFAKRRDPAPAQLHLRTSDPHIYAAGDIARWPEIFTCERVRVEHWVVAERQDQAAAANMLDRSRPFTAPPFLWTKHFDLSIRYVGHADEWDEIVIDGDLADRDAAIASGAKAAIL